MVVLNRPELARIGPSRQLGSRERLAGAADERLPHATLNAALGQLHGDGFPVTLRIARRLGGIIDGKEGRELQLKGHSIRTHP